MTVLWLLLAAGLALGCLAAIATGQRFAPGMPRDDMPMLVFALALSAAGALFLLARPLLQCTAGMAAPAGWRCGWIGAFGVGLGLRLLLLASEPILEVDFNRYLWDGGTVARGYNPYAVAPARIGALPYDDPRLELSKAAGSVFDQISYSELKTAYPPVAQAAFALAHLIEPWSLTAWRMVAIAAEISTFVLLVALLRACGRNELWSVLYWWNPLVLKETVNSAHSEVVLLPFLLGSLLLAVRGRPIAATGALGLAVGVKLWPVLLLPLVLRPLIGHPMRLAGALALVSAMLVTFAAPVWLGGLDQSSGFVSFASHWTTGSALFAVLERVAAVAVGVPASESLMPGRIVRLVSALAVFSLAVKLAWAPIAGPRELIRRIYITATVLLLLSPAQFPWYVLWCLPLAVLQPGIGWHVATATLPLYYTAFHFRQIGTYAIFETWIVWLIWVPVWAALAWDWWRARWTPAGGNGNRP